MKAPIVTFPGKLGDMLFAVPAMQALRKLYGGAPLTLVTTPYCQPALTLLLEKLPDLFERVHVKQDYRIESDAPGLQPWRIPPPPSAFSDGHRDVFHLGFRRFPYQHESITETLARHYRLEITPGPWLPRARVDRSGPIVMHAPVGDPWANQVLRELLEMVGGAPVLLAGVVPEFVEYQRMELDRVEGVTLREIESLKDVWDLCDGASAFIGIASAPAVVAAAAGLPCRWVMQRGADHRSVPRGCDVTLVRAKAAA